MSLAVGRDHLVPVWIFNERLSRGLEAQAYRYRYGSTAFESCRFWRNMADNANPNPPPPLRSEDVKALSSLRIMSAQTEALIKVWLKTKGIELFLNFRVRHYEGIFFTHISE